MSDNKTRDDILDIIADAMANAHDMDTKWTDYAWAAYEALNAGGFAIVKTDLLVKAANALDGVKP